MYRKVNTQGHEVKQSSKRNWRLIIGIIIFFLLIVVIGVFIYILPGFQQANWGESTVLVVGMERAGEGLVEVDEGEIYIKLESMQEYIDPGLFWDESEKTAIITTEDRLVHMQSEDQTAHINLRPVEMEFPLRETEGYFYIPLLFGEEFYAMNINYHPPSDTVVIEREEDNAISGKVKQDSLRLREKPSWRGPTLDILNAEDELIITTGSVEDEESDWYFVRTEEGMLGFVHERNVELTGDHEPATEREELPPKREKTEIEHPITLVWEFAYISPDTSKIGEMEPVDVVSPTWFHVDDKEGNIRDIADPAYVEWARERGYQVWALVTNSFDPELTAAVLTSSSKRKHIINQLVTLANEYNLDGINIDFENFHYDYRDYFTQFMRELAPLCREQGLVLSVDVTIKSLSEYYGLSYDREALAGLVDYVALMAYDEHWGNSPVAGSVSSLPWVEKGIELTLEEVPPEKLLLGVPFYTRLWEIEEVEEEEEEEENDQKVSSNAYSMMRIDEILSEQDDVEIEWDKEAKQNLAVYEDDYKTYKVWLEDEDSMRQRIEFINEHNLAGVAAWRRGFEKPAIWKLINEVLADYEP